MMPEESGTERRMTLAYPVGEALYVNLTNRCPCACEFCIRRNGAGVYGSDSLWLEREPTVGEVMGALAAAGPSRWREVVFCGYGEPTERLDELLEIARRLKTGRFAPPIRVNTNGLAYLIAGRPTAARFAGLVDAVSISLNAPTAEEYDRLCHPRWGLRAYDAMLNFASEVRLHVPRVVLTVVATPDLTPERRRACEAVCARVGVPLRVRAFTPPPMRKTSRLRGKESQDEK